MKINIPLDELAADAIEELFTRQIPEGPRLDYKQSLFPLNDAHKFELLKDVCAFANAEGGHLIYGIAQDDEGRPASLVPFEILGVDELQNQIDSILNDLIAEPIPGLRHRAVPAQPGRFYYVVKVPASPQAPHMISMPVSKPRFYQRVNTVSVPMTITQIKELTLRIERARDAAESFVAERIELFLKDHDSFCMLHILPIYSEPYRLDMTDPHLYRRLNRLGSGNPRHCLEGYTVEWSTPSITSHSLFTRSGGVEWFRSPVADRHDAGMPIIAGTAFERGIIDFAQAVRDAGLDGLAELPALISFTIVSRNGLRMWGKDNYLLDIAFRRSVLRPDSTLLNEWLGLPLVLKRFFDVLWQSFGAPGSPNYNESGERIS